MSSSEKFVPRALRKQGGSARPGPTSFKSNSFKDKPDRPVNDRFASLKENPLEVSERSSRPLGSGSSFGGSSGPDPFYSTKPDQRLERKLFGAPQEKTESETMAQGINFDKYDDIPVEMNGENLPTPSDDFESTGLDPQLIHNVKLCGYTRPTPIQRNGIPVVINDRDLMACAQTGSGKTAAFLLPVISKLKNTEPLLPPDSLQSKGRSRKAFPRCIVMSPTRELATQIFEEARKFCYCTGTRPVVVYGGADIRLQLREIERGCEIVVATPGRLGDLVERGRISMSCVEYLVFDEADRMLDMGFEPQIRRILEQYDMPFSAEGRRTCMFSATFPSEIQQLAQDFLQDYVFLAIGRVGSTNEFITQKLENTDEREKKTVLMKILADCEGLTVIFVETKRGADSLENYLMNNGVNAISIHGDRSQQEREHALRQFKAGRYPVLVATDVASRGLDIPNVLHVINYDMPNNIDDYVHRIGRTGRCGNAGTATSFFSEKNRGMAKDLQHLLMENKQDVPAWLKEYGSFSGRSGFKKGRGGSRFGAKDFRKSKDFQSGGSRENKSWGASGGYGSRDAW